MERSTYRLRHAGSGLVVEVWAEGKRNHARLLVDDVEVASGGTGEAGRVELASNDGVRVRVQFWWTGRVWQVALVEKGALKPVLTRFEPPAGTRAARSYAFQQRHPGLYAARHVVLNVTGTVLAILGVSALVNALVKHLLPSLDLGLSLPDWSPPAWVGYLDPTRYLGPVLDWIGSLLPDLSFLGDWLDDLGPWVKYLVGFLIACGVAAQEYRRRRAADQEVSDGSDRRSRST